MRKQWCVAWAVAGLVFIGSQTFAYTWQWWESRAGSQGSFATKAGLHMGAMAITIPSGVTYVRFETGGGSGNCNLYVRLGAAPTLSTYTAKSTSYNNDDIVHIASPAAGTYFIGLCGQTAYTNVTLRVRYDTQGYNLRKDLIQTVNRERQRNGVTPALAGNAKLNAAALEHSADMALHNNCSHTGSNSSSPDVRVARTGYAASAVGENIAAGQRSVVQVMDDWMHSTGHRANILGTQFRDIGCDAALSSTGVRYWTQVFGAQ